MKCCSKCGEDKELTAFRRGAQCRACDKLVKLKWESDNHERHLEACRRRRKSQIARDPEGYKARIRASREKHVDTNRAWRERNKAKLNEQKRAWSAANPEKEKAHRRSDYLKHREKRLVAQKDYVARNRDTVLAKKRIRTKAFYTANSDRLKENGKAYRNGPLRERYLQIKRETYQRRKDKERAYERERWRNDPVYKIKVRLRWFLRMGLKGKTKSTRAVELLGCSLEDFRIYFESKFEPGMSWEAFLKRKNPYRPCGALRAFRFDQTRASEGLLSFFEPSAALG
jgi:hypothetical protein